MAKEGSFHIILFNSVTIVRTKMMYFNDTYTFNNNTYINEYLIHILYLIFILKVFEYSVKKIYYIQVKII